MFVLDLFVIYCRIYKKSSIEGDIHWQNLFSKHFKQMN